MWHSLILPLFICPSALALESQFLLQGAAVVGDPSNDMQPAGLGRLRPGRRIALSTQSIGDVKYEFEEFPEFPLDSGGPRMIPGSVSSARALDNGGIGLIIRSFNMGFNARAMPARLGPIETETLLETEVNGLRVSGNYGRALGERWLIGAGLAATQVLSRSRNLSSITGSSGADSLSATNQDERALHMQVVTGLMYDGETWGIGVTLSSASHVLAHSAKTVSKEMAEGRNPPLRTTESPQDPVSVRPQAGLGMRFKPTPWLRMYAELSRSETAEHLAFAADFGPAESGWVLAVSRNSGDIESTTHLVSASYRTRDQGLSWFVGPYYSTNQPARMRFKETAYGVKFGTEILY